MGKSGGTPKIPVTEYYASVHYAICLGEVDALNRVRVKEKIAYDGLLAGGGEVDINKSHLFGGIKKEGGVRGRLYFQSGTRTQKLASAIATKLGLTPDTAPGYRGIATAFFGEIPSSPTDFTEEPSEGSGGFSRTVGLFSDSPFHFGYYGGPGFYWSAGQPIVPAAWFHVTRIGRGWYPEAAAIAPDRGSSGGIDPVYFSLQANDSSDAGPSGHVAADRGVRINVPTRETRVLVRVDPNNFFKGWSPWGRQTLSGNEGPIGFVRVIPDENEAQAYTLTPQGEPALINDGVPVYENAQAVADAFGVHVLRGATSYRFVLQDDPIDDNTGGMSLIVGGGEFADMNPAHIIRECLTNSEWGMGAPETAIDDVTFRAAAKALFDEGFGLSLMFSQQDTIENFVREILDHIEGHMYVDPADGLFKLVLVRDDYDASTLRVIDESSSRVRSYQVRTPSEAVNEITVTYTDGATEDSASYTVQDLGAIVANGGEVNAESRDYYAIRNGDLAARVAARDIAASTAPVATAKVDMNRSAWDLTPGQVVKFSSQEHNADQIIMRVLSVDYGSKDERKIAVNLIQDIFSFERIVPAGPPPTQAVDIAQEPTVADDVEIVTLNYFLTQSLIDPAIAGSAAYPDVFVGVLASTGNADAAEIELVGEVTAANGVTNWIELGTRTLTSRAELPSAWPAEAETTSADFVNATRGVAQGVDGFVLIGENDGDESNMELALLASFDGTNWTVLRGALDTVPQAWPSGTTVRFLSPASFVDDQTVRAALSEVNYRVLPRTSVDLLGFDAAPTETHTLTERPWLPTRPANVIVNSTAWGVIDAVGVDPIPMSWSLRNRLTEDSVALAWDAASITPETGQVTEIRIHHPVTDALVNTVTAAEGVASVNVAASDFLGLTRATLRFYAVNGALESLQAAEREIVLAVGYGNNYGFDYGDIV